MGHAVGPLVNVERPELMLEVQTRILIDEQNKREREGGMHSNKVG